MELAFVHIEQYGRKVPEAFQKVKVRQIGHNHPVKLFYLQTPLFPFVKKSQSASRLAPFPVPCGKGNQVDPVGGVTAIGTGELLVRASVEGFKKENIHNPIIRESSPFEKSGIPVIPCAGVQGVLCPGSFEGFFLFSSRPFTLTPFLYYFLKNG